MLVGRIFRLPTDRNQEQLMATTDTPDEVPDLARFHFALLTRGFEEHDLLTLGTEQPKRDVVHHVPPGFGASYFQLQTLHRYTQPRLMWWVKCLRFLQRSQ